MPAESTAQADSGGPSFARARRARSRLRNVRRLGELFQLDCASLSYDVPSTHFEGAGEGNPQAQRGHSRDRRPDRKRLNVAPAPSATDCRSVAKSSPAIAAASRRSNRRCWRSRVSTERPTGSGRWTAAWCRPPTRRFSDRAGGATSPAQRKRCRASMRSGYSPPTGGEVRRLDPGPVKPDACAREAR